MSSTAEMGEPVLVTRENRQLRRRARLIVTKAWVGRWEVPVLLTVVFSGLYFGGIVPLLRMIDADFPRPVWWQVAVLLGVLMIVDPLAAGWQTYWAAGRRGTRVYYLDTGTAEAVVQVQPDPRRGQLPGDQRVHTRAAWPKGRGAGSELRQWVIDMIHAERGRATGTATPWAAGRLYKGSVIDGWTFPCLIRTASRARSG